MNLDSREVKVHPLHHLEAYPIVFGGDGRVYTGSSSGEVFSWNPLSDVWGPLGPRIFRWPDAPYNHVRVLCEGKVGWLYSGSCYGERARINMFTHKVEKLPETPEKGNWYISSVATLSASIRNYDYVFVPVVAMKSAPSALSPEGINSSPNL